MKSFTPISKQDIVSIIQKCWETKPGPTPEAWEDAVADEILRRINENMPFSGLSPAQIERLAILTEEMGETHQAIGKILRHGYESKHPDGGPTNRESLEREMGDVEYASSLLKFSTDIDAGSVSKAFVRKGEKIGRYTHHQKSSE